MIKESDICDKEPEMSANTQSHNDPSISQD